MRLLAIIAGSLMAVATIILMTRIWGLGQTFSVYEHPFFSHSSPTLAVVASTTDQVDEILNHTPSAVIWLDTRFSKDKKVFVLPPDLDSQFLNSRRDLHKENPQEPIFTSGRLAEYNWEVIHNFFPNTKTIDEYYDKYPKTRFILNVVDNVSDAHLTLVEALANSRPDERTLIQSETLVLMTAIKELKPEWLYGTSRSDIMRFLSFDSMWILPSVQFKGDVGILPQKVSGRPAYNEEILEELQRRHKKILLGPLESKEELESSHKVPIDGYIFRNFEEFSQWLGQSPVS